ncbi:hypothetical protein EMIHUDRAFT_452786 [Emiliania huxleyi CCMP1516]|uniref:Protein kinase domain-containing protein n=2 Tax=Emiliania huxleyi TaxID=2903 RepID=A0A0D3IFL2_EMIH1|nr:hypothetical protein EMIHUDRAFT_452786 [Emiliania huxleyi CCMP1516]EOD10047.1 hypothetical protein EMIHUDRAFT_452786 [Emiliania huxleyi CCMP1516]|eukprot:XP_005762476.1 hypothetical protein EMIHUDRAFT_452786 [Emiliania huxleyi CCMP1516]
MSAISMRSSSTLESVSPSRRLDATYELLETRLGRGQFAEVRLALRKGRLNERVAVKLLPRVKVPEAKLARELEVLRAVSELRHPALVTLLDAYQTPSELQLVLQLLPRGSLLDLVVERRRPLPEPEARTIVRQVASGLAALHRAGIVHRDVKLQNVLLDEDGQCRSPRIDSPCGTPGFIAPEMLGESGYDFAADVWALGVVAYVLLTGRPPFDIPPAPDSPTAEGGGSASLGLLA